MTHFINFSTEKLHTVNFFYGWYHGYKQNDPSGFFSQIRALIAKQFFLKKLSLGIVCDELFTEPLIIQSKLRHLDLMQFRSNNRLDNPGSSSEQEENFLDFIESQNELESLDVELHEELSEEVQRHVEQLQQKILDLKLRSMKIEYRSPQPPALGIWGTICSNFNKVYKSMLEGQPNMAVRELKIKIFDGKSADILKFFSLVVSKFPNLKRINLCVHGSSNWNFPKLDGLVHLSELSFRNFIRPETIKIRNLKFLEIFYHHATTPDLNKKFNNLLAHHGAIEKLDINLFVPSYESDESDEPSGYGGYIEQFGSFVNLVNFAIKNLKNLKCIVIKEIEDKIEWTWIVAVIKEIITSITDHAQTGFLFRSTGGLEIYKRVDGKVVRKHEGKWKIVPSFIH